MKSSNEGDRLDLLMENTRDDLIELINYVNSYLENKPFSQRTLYNVNLVLEEVLTNVVKYAFDDTDYHEIAVSVKTDPSGILLSISDDGAPFNPLDNPEPEMKSILDSEPGGLGIHLVKKTAEQIEYTRENNRNTLTVLIR